MSDQAPIDEEPGMPAIGSIKAERARPASVVRKKHSNVKFPCTPSFTPHNIGSLATTAPPERPLPLPPHGQCSAETAGSTLPEMGSCTVSPPFAEKALVQLGM